MLMIFLGGYLKMQSYDKLLRVGYTNQGLLAHRGEQLS